MKILVSIILVSIISISTLFAQFEKAEEQTQVTNAFLGISSGINNMSGLLGVTGEVRLVNNFSIFGAAGIGGWVTKASAGVKYYRSFPYQTHFALSFSSASGIDEFEMELETEDGDSEDVTMNLKSAKNLNLIIGYNWKVFSRARFHFDFGYSVPLQSKAYEITSNHELSKDSETIMNMMTPGGLIVGLGISFSL
ncbi:MAG: hypothetical protein PF517_16440 [Salinivirgaceae bacterium]|jgi:hypothetical protein|nr:hypothetical protein [Salinivirgaceae bacterium]